MKRQFLLMRLLLLFALIVGSGSSAWGQSNESSNHTGNVTLSGSTNATVTISGTDYSGKKLGSNGSGGSCTFTAPTGTKYIHIHVAAWNGKSPTLTVKNGSTTVASGITLTSDSNIKGTTTTYNLNGQDKVTTDYYKVVTLPTALTAQATITLQSVSERVVIWGVTAETVAAGTTEAPTISGTTPFLENTTVTITNAASADGADIYYTLNGSDPTTTTSATCFAYSDPFQISATTTVKAIAKKSTDTNASSVVSKTFTKVTPISVTDALTAIAALADNGTIADQYVRGIVSTAGSLTDGAITYSVSVDGTKTNELYVYNGKGLNGANFENSSDIAIGDEVVIYGTLKKYKNGTTITPEFAAGNYLLSKVRKPAPTFSLDITEKILEAYGNKTVDVTLTTNTDGEITCESNDEDVATVTLKSGKVYTITAQTEGTATITIRSALSANYAPASATVAITVQDSRADAGISFAEDEIAKTWGESFTGQELTNTNSVAVTWSSTDETVATVNSTGVVNVLKAGSTTIKATFDGDATYKAAVASYNLTINKANAGLSFSETEFDVDLNDKSFVAPTLNNPNSLTVTYSSSNEEIALVDENDGTLVLETSSEGTVTITASFAGNDNFKAGNAQYTITITDPTKKGTKKNPYTVAEVINGTATGTGIYVRGFIVGEYVGKTTAPKTSGFTTNANIAISDPFTTSPTASGSIPVALPTDALKSAWGCQGTKGALLGYEVLIKGNAQEYFSVNGIKSTSEVSAVSIPVTITDAKYATFCSPYKLDYSGTGVKVYMAKSTGSSVKLTEIEDGIVPANAGVVLYCETAGTYAIPVTTEDVNNYDALDNELIGINERTLVKYGGEGSKKNFILSKEGEVVGFYKATADGAYLAAHRAYLSTADVTASRSFLGFDDETTGIESIDVSTENTNVAREYYNLNGQRVTTPTKGLYIVNGKKVIINK